MNTILKVLLSGFIVLLISCGGGGGESSSDSSPVIESDPIRLDTTVVSKVTEVFRQEFLDPILFFEEIRSLYQTPIPSFADQNGSWTIDCEISGFASVALPS